MLRVRRGWVVWYASAADACAIAPDNDGVVYARGALFRAAGLEQPMRGARVRVTTYSERGVIARGVLGFRRWNEEGLAAERSRLFEAAKAAGSWSEWEVRNVGPDCGFKALVSGALCVLGRDIVHGSDEAWDASLDRAVLRTLRKGDIVRMLEGRNWNGEKVLAVERVGKRQATRDGAVGATRSYMTE